MSGLGHVAPGGPPLLERLSPSVTLLKASVGPMDNNAYLLTDGDEAVLIDAAQDAPRLLLLIHGTAVRTIVTTHRHGDHLQALAEVSAATGARLVAGQPDAAAVASSAGVRDVQGVWDGDRIPLGTEHLEVIGLVGHTPGSIALAYQGPAGPVHLFTGDSLFPGGVGKTGSDQDFRSLLADVESKLFARFDDATMVHPGHGDDTTLGAERPDLDRWRSRGW